MSTTQSNGTYQEQKAEYVRTGQLPDKVKRVQLFDSNGEPMPFNGIKTSRIPKAFNERAKANQFIKQIAEEGPAVSKLAFMVGTFAETAYAGWTVSMVNGSRMWLIALMVWGVGAIWETAFGFAWYRTGSSKLAGKQVGLNREMYNRCLIFMSCGLMSALISALFSFPLALQGWLVVQVLATVSILRLQRRIKESHPTFESRQRQTDREAQWQAAWMDEAGKEQDLYLKRTRHERTIERMQLDVETEEEAKVLNSRQYRKEKAALAKGKHLSGSPGGFGLGKLKQILSRN